MGRMVKRRGIEAIGQEAELNQHARHVRGAEHHEACVACAAAAQAPFVVQPLDEIALQLR